MAITPENVVELIKGDLAPSRNNALSALVEGFILPLMSNDANVSAWPNVACVDMIKQAQALRSQALVVSGQMTGKTKLPLPEGAGVMASNPDVDVTAGGAGEDELLFKLESAVVQWSHQVNDVLKHDSAQPLIDGEHVGPLIELDFWSKKKANLVFIEDQLKSQC